MNHDRTWWTEAVQRIGSSTTVWIKPFNPVDTCIICGAVVSGDNQMYCANCKPIGH